jgi:hypothetical protein
MHFLADDSLEVATAAVDSWSDADTNAVGEMVQAEAMLVMKDKVIGAIGSRWALAGVGQEVLFKFGAGMLMEIAKGVYADSEMSDADKRQITALLKTAAIDAGTSALPIYGAWKDMYQLADRVWSRAYDRYFQNAAEVGNEFDYLHAAINRRFKVAALERIWQYSQFGAGEDNLDFPPVELPATLPAAFRGSGFASGVDNLVVVTHGWNAAASDWPSVYVNTACAARGGTPSNELPQTDKLTHGVASWCKAGNTLILSYNWYKDSLAWKTNPVVVRPPVAAWSNAKLHGERFATDVGILGMPLKHVHVLGHSAGSNFVQAFSNKVKALTPTAKTQLTFLDAYCPTGPECGYGAGADWAEQYLHDHNGNVDGGAALATALGAPLAAIPAVASMYIREVTGTQIKSAYNFDLTSLASIADPIASHAYPYNVYLRSMGVAAVPANTVTFTQAAAVLSKEINPNSWAVGDPARFTALSTEYPLGYKCAVVDPNSRARSGTSGECAYVRAYLGPEVTPQGYVDANVYRSCAATPLSGPGSVVTTACTAPVAYQPNILKAAGNTIAATGFQGVTVKTITTNGPANTMAFSIGFASSSLDATAQVFVDDRQVYVVGARELASAVRQIVDLPVGNLIAGQHQIQVVLRDPSLSSARVDLNNVAFSFAAPPVTCSMDFNGDGAVNETDALLFNRWLLGFRGEALVAGIVPFPANTTVSAFAAATAARMAASAAAHDIDGDGRASVTTDGLIFSRLVRGVVGVPAVSGANGTGALRTTYDAIRSRMNSNCGTSFSAGPTVTSISPMSGAKGTYTVIRLNGAELPATTGLKHLGSGGNCLRLPGGSTSAVDFRCLMAAPIGTYAVTAGTESPVLVSTPTFGPTFNFDVRAAVPSLTRVSPASGGGIFTLRIVGVDMPPNASIEIGGVACAATGAINATDAEYRCNLSSLAPGRYDVTLKSVVVGGSVIGQLVGAAGFLVQ